MIRYNLRKLSEMPYHLIRSHRYDDLYEKVSWIDLGKRRRAGSKSGRGRNIWLGRGEGGGGGGDRVERKRQTDRQRDRERERERERDREREYLYRGRKRERERERERLCPCFSVTELFFFIALSVQLAFPFLPYLFTNEIRKWHSDSFHSKSAGSGPGTGELIKRITPVPRLLPTCCVCR